MIFWCRGMTSAHTQGISHCDKHRENCPGSKNLGWPTVLYFKPMVSQPSCFQVCGRRENTWQRKRHLPYRAAWGTQMRKGETSALWVFTSHLISSHQASAPQNSTPICHWLVIEPLWVNVGERSLSKPRQAEGPTG